MVDEQLQHSARPPLSAGLGGGCHARHSSGFSLGASSWRVGGRYLVMLSGDGTHRTRRGLPFSVATDRGVGGTLRPVARLAPGCGGSRRAAGCAIRERCHHFFRGQARGALAATGGRPGEGMFSTLLATNDLLPPYWGLEPGKLRPFVALGLSVLAALGALELLGGKQWAPPPSPSRSCSSVPCS